MSDLTLEERIERLEKLFQLHWGPLDYDKQKDDLRALHERADEVHEKVVALGKKVHGSTQTAKKEENE